MSTPLATSGTILNAVLRLCLFVPLLAACSGGADRPDQGVKDAGSGGTGTSGETTAPRLLDFGSGSITLYPRADGSASAAVRGAKRLRAVVGTTMS